MSRKDSNFEDDELIEFEFYLDDVDAKFRMDGTRIRFKVPVEQLVRSDDYLHEFFKADLAIEHMPESELEKLRELIVPEIDSINAELQKDLENSNIVRWEQLNNFKTEIQALHDKYKDQIKRYEKSIKDDAELIRNLKLQNTELTTTNRALIGDNEIGLYAELEEANRQIRALKKKLAKNRIQ